MSLRRSRRLRVEALEDRVTPAVTVRFYGGLLTIQGDNVTNNVLIAETGTPGKFAVTANGTFAGSYKFSNLQVMMGNGNDTLALQIKTAITGNITATMGNGSDVVTTENS